jgi:putative transposase
MEYRRDHTPGTTYFFTVVTADRKPILVDEIQRLRRAFRETMVRKPFKIEAIVILPDHLHTLWTLSQGDEDFSARWRILKWLFSSGLSNDGARDSLLAKREKGVWQRRFWEHRIRDERDWANHLDYIHYNPVRHGYVSSPQEWPYSSFHRYVARGILPVDWGSSPPVIPDFPVGE